MQPTVLIIDDDPDLVRLMAKFLKLEGFAPVSAANGREALAYLQSGGEASVILLDLRMPEMDGWAFRAAQRSDPAIAHIPVIVVSGVDAWSGPQDLEAAAVFEKPASFSDVIKTVRRLCSSKGA
ncbi:MAG TPA: response regulator [Vicinamibacterales bacterium]|nr:response regulator [Vicinamibacterales bacterium]